MKKISSKAEFTRKPIIEKNTPPWAIPADARDPDLQFVQRAQWVNKGGNQEVYPLKLFRPTSLKQLSEIIYEAEKEKCRVKAVGSKHAWSDVAVSTDFMIDTHGLNAVLPIENEMDMIHQDTLATYLNPEEEETIFQVEAGISIRELNQELFKRDLALLNMGGYDEQTIVGAASTSTHGTGVTLQPLCDCFLSITLISTHGEIFRIEPHAGITNREIFVTRYPHIHLIKNDDIFHSVTVSLGTMGVIYSVIMKVRKLYYLKENRRLTTWEEVKKDLKNKEMYNYRHYDLILNPYEIKGNRSVLVTTRDICDAPKKNASYGSTHRWWAYELMYNYPWMGRTLGEILKGVFYLFPKSVPATIEGGLKRLVHKEISEISYKILNLGAANYIQGCSAELAIHINEDNSCINTVELIFELLESYVKNGEQYITSPIAMRFVKASDQYLSMMHEVPAGKDGSVAGSQGIYCLIELPVISFSVGGLEILERIEKEMYKCGVRPHWGQVNFISGSHIKIDDLYKKLHEWKAVFKYFNYLRVFSNEFTYRCGFDPALEFDEGTDKPAIDAHAMVNIEKTKNNKFTPANMQPLHPPIDPNLG